MLLALFQFWKSLLRLLRNNRIKQHADADRDERSREHLPHREPTAPQVSKLHVRLAHELDGETEAPIHDEEHAKEGSLGAWRTLARKREQHKEDDNALKHCLIELGGMAGHHSRLSPEHDTPRGIGRRAPQLAVHKVGAAPEEQPDRSPDATEVSQREVRNMREMRGDLTTPAQSPYRDRPMEESLDLFARMRAGEFEDGRMTLRAKIDLASGNFNMRDPVIYRINHMPHHRTGTKWCIYPMYDFAHPIEDAMEHITHSLCSLEFEDHRPLYDWVINNVTLPAKPRQIEFARLGINNTVMSKRKLRALVEGGYVSGWDDPRMPTICGLRRRGYTPASIRNFSVRNGVSKVNSTVEYSFLEHCLREDLNLTAKRVMGVLNPVKLILTNYPEDRTETFEVENNPNRPEDGTRTVTFGRELYIEAEDFMETPVKGYFRLFPGNEVRLKTTYVVKCTGCKKDENGNVVEVYAEYDPESRGGNPADGRKIKSTIHWVDAKNAEDAEIRLYDNLFTVEDPDAGDFLELLNPDSLKVLTGCKVEASLKTAKPGESFQFMRQGYFCVDNKDSAEDHLVFNRSVSLKDGFKKKK